MGSRERFDGPFGRPVLRSTCAAVPSFETRRDRQCLERPPGRGGEGGIHRLEQSRWLRRSARSPNSAHVQRNACCARWLVWPGGGPWSRESACQLTCRASWTGRARDEGRRWQEEKTHLLKWDIRICKCVIIEVTKMSCEQRAFGAACAQVACHALRRLRIRRTVLDGESLRPCRGIANRSFAGPSRHASMGTISPGAC